MNSPEERLRRLADDERWHDRTPPRLDRSLGPAGRPRRSGVVVAAAVVTVLAVAGAGVAIGHFSHQRAAPAPASSGKAVTVIPWKPIPPAAEAADVTSPPICVAGELTAHSDGVGPAMGSWNMGIDVSNAGPLCSMPNSSVTLRVPHDGGPDTILAHANEGEDGRSPELIAAHSTVNYHVTFGTSCQPTSTPSPADPTLSIGVAGDDVPVTGTAVPPELASCRTVFLGEPETAIFEVDPYPQLTVSLALPESAKTGSTISYTVTLTNRWRKPFTFASCPNYDQELSVPGSGKHAPKWTQVGRTVSYTLNCTSMKTLNQGQQATFAMRTTLPSTRGLAQLGWYLKYYSGPSSIGTMLLT